MQAWINTLQNNIQVYHEKGLYRKRMPISQRLGGYCQSDTRSYLSFINNDYLGLANHPTILEGYNKALKKYGIGSSGSALLGGYYTIQQKLETALATFLGYESVLVFSSGYLANLGVLTTLLNKNNIVFQDRANHASLIDGVRYSQATLKRYPHMDMESLIKQLEFIDKSKTKLNDKKPWIVSDSLFSMSGTIAPLPQLINISKKYQAPLLIDDAHGIGVLGENGRGISEYFNKPQTDALAKGVTILVGTFGKAFGTQGAFVAANHTIIESLIQFSRQYIYTTALSPALAEATYASLQIIQQESWRREHLRTLITRFTQGCNILNLPTTPSVTPIQTIIIGNSHKSLKIGHLLKENHILVGVIRSPSVPVNTARLRINLSVNHTLNDIDTLLTILEPLCKLI